MFTEMTMEYHCIIIMEFHKPLLLLLLIIGYDSQSVAAVTALVGTTVAAHFPIFPKG